MWLGVILSLMACPPATETGTDSPSDTDQDSQPECPTWYEDADGDGAGDPATAVVTCEPDAGLVDRGGDCNDNRASVYPGAGELCGDGVVNDCDSDVFAAAQECPMDTVDLGDAITWTGQQGGDFAARALSSAGDFNGDGFTDLLVGAYAEFGEPDDARAGKEGAAYLITGSAEGFTGGSLDDAAARWTGGLDHRGGRAVSPLGDLDGDGFDDLLVGAFGVEEKGEYSGAAYVLMGSDTPQSHPLADAITFLGENEDSEAGYALSGVGDVSGDGIPDFVVGAPHEDTVDTDAGAIYLVLGTGSVPTGGDLEDMDGLVRGEVLDDHLGEWVAPGGDVNGDGIQDVAIGAYKESTAGRWAGAIYVFEGGEQVLQGPAAEAWKWTGEGVNAHAGVCVNTAGDVNGDGYDDIAAGANLGGEGGIGYLVLGSADGIGSDTLGNAATRVVGSPGAGLGLAVSGGGDMDGDGLDDALFGAPPWQNHAGVSVVIFGEAQLPPTVSMEDAWLVQSGNNGGHQGEALYLGDVTGDGLADLFLGVPQAGSQAGVAALIVAGAY